MYTFSVSLGSSTTVCVCEPRHVCTWAMYFGLGMSVTSKMRMQRSGPGGAGVDPHVPGRFGGVPLPRLQADATVGNGGGGGHIELRGGAGREGERRDDGRGVGCGFHCELRLRENSIRLIRSISVVWSAY